MQDLLGTGLAKIISALAVVMALVMGYGYMSDNDVDTTIAQINQIHSGMVGLYANDASGYTSAAISDQDLITNGVIPDNMVTSATLANNAFGGDVTVTGATSEYTLGMDGIDEKQCVKLMTKFPSGGGATKIRAASTMAGLSSATDETVPVGVADATTACSGATAIQFTME